MFDSYEADQMSREEPYNILDRDLVEEKVIADAEIEDNDPS